MYEAAVMLDIFAGRTDVYGSDWGSARKGTVDEQLMLEHLTGHHGIGIYPIVHDRKNRLWVKWGCCDIDTGDWGETWALVTALRSMGLSPFVERSRSKGWHVWVFCDKWVLARDMRRALKVAYKAIGLAAKEANPKSEELRENQLGNYVRLPYKGALSGPIERQTMLQGYSYDGDGEPMSLVTFLTLAGAENALPGGKQIKHWADKWYEPPKQHRCDPAELLSNSELATLASKMPHDLFLTWKMGPKHDHKRSDTLVMLAYRLAALRFTPDEVFQLIKSADMLWGKYHERVNGDEYMADIVERGFNGNPT
jgi:hypothetical protein